MLSRAGEASPIGTPLGEGMVVAPPHESVDRLGLVFKTLLAQGHVIRGLRVELELMRRHQAGLAVQIDKFDEELRLAARLQRQFLPQRLPQIPGVSFDVLFRPASYVSGDIYDIHQLSPDLTGFYVADAVGHGVPAALLTMFIKQAFQGRENGERKGRILGLDELMVRLNRELLSRQSQNVQFTTACYGRLNTATRELELVRAGHPSPLLMRANGSVEPLTPDGPLLGVFEDGEFEIMRTKLEPGDRLLVYSDGFELAFGDEVHESDPRHMRELRSLGSGDSREAMRNLELRLDEQAGSLHQRDDLTAILIDMGGQQAA
jgi:sigma-B regulation protein RsbU (phosphoserine phosphatase)